MQHALKVATMGQQAGRGRAAESGQKQAAGHIKQTKQTEEAEQETAAGSTARHL